MKRGSSFGTKHVLVIAGVPGIGKTTLARMLVADAVLDGYEPVEVSADVEEAWDVLDDGAKQIFLYDDFLGRTALSDRFAKNEDRRLIDFMRPTARRRSSRFVLTTREYILRQAVQFYERRPESPRRRPCARRPAAERATKRIVAARQLLAGHRIKRGAGQCEH